MFFAPRPCVYFERGRNLIKARVIAAPLPTVNTAGHSGERKAMTTKLMVLFRHPASGRVRIWVDDGVRESRQANRLLGFVPGEPYLYDKLSGGEFLDFIADMHGLDRQEAAARIERE